MANQNSAILCKIGVILNYLNVTTFKQNEQVQEVVILYHSYTCKIGHMCNSIVILCEDQSGNIHVNYRNFVLLEKIASLLTGSEVCV